MCCFGRGSQRISDTSTWLSIRDRFINHMMVRHKVEWKASKVMISPDKASTVKWQVKRSKEKN
jgi:hypothetical protein